MARTAANWLRSPDRLAALALRLRRMLAVERPLRIAGSRLVLGAETFTELHRARAVGETWTADWVRGLPAGAVLWDVGANVGVFTLLAAESPSVARVVAIEPAFLNYAALMRNVLRNGLSAKVIALPVGLGETTGALAFNLQNLKAGDSMHSFGAIFPLRDRTTAPAATMSVLCYRLDDLVRVPGLPFPTHLKLDIDGLEESVLRGGRATLADPRLVGLQVEVMDLAADLPRRRSVVALLEGLGWRLAETIPHASAAPIIADLRFGR